MIVFNSLYAFKKQTKNYAHVSESAAGLCSSKYPQKTMAKNEAFQLEKFASQKREKINDRNNTQEKANKRRKSKY